MSQPLLVTGTIGIDTILTPGGRADGVLGGSVSFAAVAAQAVGRLLKSGKIEIREKSIEICQK